MGVLTSVFPFVKLMDLANSLTSINIAISFIAIYFAWTDHIYFSAISICAAAVLDFLDGYIARTWLYNRKDNRSFGKQLDSLADLLNFSVAPAMIIFHLNNDGAAFFSGLLLLLSGCLRLSLFSVISGSHPGSYSGLPTTYAGVIYALFLQCVAYDNISASTLIYLNLCIAVVQVINIKIPKYSAIPTVVVFIALFLSVRFFIH